MTPTSATTGRRFRASSSRRANLSPTPPRHGEGLFCSAANPFRYAGQYQDAESGLYYLRARYYDPATQQFLTRDPLVAATEQAYNYAGGSPLNATDPSGLRYSYGNEGGLYGDEEEYNWYKKHGGIPDAGWGGITGPVGNYVKFCWEWWTSFFNQPGAMIASFFPSNLPVEVAEPKIDYVTRWRAIDDKSQGFADLGWTEANKGDLKSLLESIGQIVDRSNPTSVTQYGAKFEQTVQVTGPNGQMGRITTVWQIDKGSDVLRLITAIAQPFR